MFDLYTATGQNGDRGESTTRRRSGSKGGQTTASRRRVLSAMGTGCGVGLAGCIGAIEDDEDTVEITDLADRTVEVPSEIEEIIGVGSGAVRILCQMRADDMIIAVEERETTWLAEATYNIANPHLRDLPVIGDHGGDAELIAAEGPDVVFSTASAEELDTLQDRSGIPTIGIGGGEILDLGAPLLEEEWEFLGDVLGKEDRASELLSLYEETQDDYERRTADITEDGMPSSYISGISFRGGQGLRATRPFVAVFQLVGAVNNVAADLDWEGVPHIEISAEQLLDWDPEFIFVDLTNADLVRDDVEENPELQELTAIQEDNVHGILPHGQYGVSHVNVMASVYYVGSVLYPDEFADVDVESRTDELFEAFYGEPVYDEMAEIYGGFGTVDLG